MPRHQEIVATILQTENARTITLLIGVAEVLMACWIASGIQSKWSTIAQIMAVATMNCLEFFLAPHLLLWGKLNALFALIFIVVVFGNEFLYTKKAKQ